MFEDRFNRPIGIGDIVAFSDTGGGYAVPGVALGEVIGFTKKGIKVFYLMGDHTREQVEEQIEDRSVPPYYSGYGKDYYHMVGTGNFQDRNPETVMYKTNRFIVIDHI